MTGKEKLECVLNGGIPDTPPHWELVFQIEKEMFGIDLEAAPEADRASLQLDVYHRLVDEFGWAAIRGGYDLAEIERTKNALGHKALVPAYDADGVFWMPNGDGMMDFTVRLFEQPEELHAEARQKCGRAKQFFKQAVDAGADFFHQIRGYNGRRTTGGRSRDSSPLELGQKYIAGFHSVPTEYKVRMVCASFLVMKSVVPIERTGTSDNSQSL